MNTFSGSFWVTRVFFYILFFVTPLLVIPVNYELFEFNKMMFVYLMTILIVNSILIQFVRLKKVYVPTTPLDIPIFLFLLAMLISTIQSIDPHMSLWGYYGRFNGGLVSIICYILLYYSFIIAFSEKLSEFPSNMKVNFVHKITGFFSHPNYVKTAAIFFFTSAILVSVYAIAQKFGIDAHLWVQDVQNRVFSTLGQPNWLAAYITTVTLLTLGVLARSFSRWQATMGSALLGSVIVISLLYAVNKTGYCQFAELLTGFIGGSQSCLAGSLYTWLFLSLFLGALFFTVNRLQHYLSFIFTASLSSVFYIVLLATKSRSGFLAFWIASGIFLLLLLVKTILISKRAIWHFSLKDVNKNIKSYIIRYLVLSSILVLFTIVIEPPFALPQILTKNQPVPVHSSTAFENQPAVSFDTDITDSGDIRKIVWTGAWSAARARPFFGFGVETFSWIYYRFKPLEHNLTSEWDFLYNKAHNEFLNYAATSGFVGLGTYLLLIIAAIWWLIHAIWKEESLSTVFIYTALLCTYISLHISHFFGFSVVITSLLFWLLPAAAFSLTSSTNRFEKTFSFPHSSKKILIGSTVALSFFLFFAVFNGWLADYYFAKGVASARNDRYQSAYSYLIQAHKLNPQEPLYQSELSETLSVLAYAASEQEEASASADFAQEAIRFSNSSLSISPANVSFWKSRTRLFYNLSQIDPVFLNTALESMETTQKLSPTDPKVAYNRAILLHGLGRTQEAILVLEEAIQMKSNYRDAAWALSLFYEEEENMEKRDEWLNYILENINPEDNEVREKLAV